MKPQDAVLGELHGPVVQGTPDWGPLLGHWVEYDRVMWADSTRHIVEVSWGSGGLRGRLDGAGIIGALRLGCRVTSVWRGRVLPWDLREGR